MAQKNQKGILRALITGSSLLLLIIVTLVLLYANSLQPSKLFPQNVADWNRILTVYLVVFGLVLTGILIYSPKTLRGLVKANYWRSFFLSFIPNAIVASIFLIALKMLIKGTGSLNIFTAISYMPLYILFIHLFVVSQVEEIMFKGLIYNSIVDRTGNRNAGNLVSVFLFSIWHYAKTGGNIVAMVTYIPLRFWWNYTSEYGVPVLRNWMPKVFGATPRTCQAGAGQHFAWNMFITGFIAPFRI